MTEQSMYSNKDKKSSQPRAEVVPRQGISIVWFVPFIALVFGLWLTVKIMSEQGVFITIEFENGAGIVPKKTEVRYKGLVTGMVQSVEPSEDLQHVIAEVEISKTFADYLTENTRFWLVSADISLQGVSGLDTLISGSYINILPDSTKEGDSQDHFIALNEAPQLDMSTPGLHLSLKTSVLGSISENSPITFKQIPIGYVTGYQYVEQEQVINLNIFIEQEYAHLVKENSLFWNTSGVQVTASITAGIKVNTDSIASMIGGGIAVDTLSYQEKLPPAKNGQEFPLHADFQSAEMGHEIQLTLDWNSGINHNAAILYQGLTIGTIESFSKIDPKTRKITAKAKVNPRVVPYLTEQSQFYIVSPHIDLTGISNAKTLLSGAYISIRPSLQGKPTDQFSVFSTKPPYKYTEPGLHLVLESNDRRSLQVGSHIYFKQQAIGTVQAVETIGVEQHLIHVHVQKDYQHYVNSSSHFYNNSGLKINANLQGVTIEAQSLQTMLTGGISFVNVDSDKESTRVVNGDKFTLFANQALAEQRTSFTLTVNSSEPIKENTRIVYRGEEIGAIHRIEVQAQQSKLYLGLLPQYETILRDGTQFWLAKPNLSLSGATDTDALFGGSYITFSLDSKRNLKNSTSLGSSDQNSSNQNDSNQRHSKNTAFELLLAPPAKHANAAGLQLSLLADSASVATSGSSVSYRGVIVGQVDNVSLDKAADKVRVNITIDTQHQSLIQADTRFYNASGILLKGGLSEFVVKTESIDAILRGGISFYNPSLNSSNLDSSDSNSKSVDNQSVTNANKADFTNSFAPNVKELDSFTLYDHFEQAKSAGLSVRIHFDNFTGLKLNSKVIYQEQTVGTVTRLIFNEQVGATALVLLNDLGAKFAQQGSQFWLVEPEIGLVGSKNVSSILAGAFIGVLPAVHNTEQQRVFEALALPPTVKQLAYGLNIKLSSQRLGSVRIGNPVLYRQVKVGEVIGIDLADTADHVDVFINIAKRYAPLVNNGSKFWNTSGINIEAGIFSGINIDSESVETLIAGGIAFATPPQSELDDLMPQVDFMLHQEVDSDWLAWQAEISIGQ